MIGDAFGVAPGLHAAATMSNATTAALCLNSSGRLLRPNLGLHGTRLEQQVVLVNVRGYGGDEWR